LTGPWWRRRKKKSPWFSDIYDELEKLGDMIDETIQRAVDSSYEKTPSWRNRVKGFSVKIDSDRDLKIDDLDSDQPWQGEEEEAVDELEPLVDILEDSDTVVVLMSIPGVDKEDIDLRITESDLSISIDTDEFEWYNEFKLPAKVNPNSARATYRNGVLEVKAKKLSKAVRNGRMSLKR